MPDTPSLLPMVQSQQVTTFESQVDPQTLQQLFDKDPEQITKDDLQLICLELRKQRARFEADETAKAMKPKKSKQEVDPVAKHQAEQLSLDDLNL